MTIGGHRACVGEREVRWEQSESIKRRWYKVNFVPSHKQINSREGERERARLTPSKFPLSFFFLAPSFSSPHPSFIDSLIHFARASTDVRQCSRQTRGRGKEARKARPWERNVETWKIILYKVKLLCVIEGERERERFSRVPRTE